MTIEFKLPEVSEGVEVADIAQISVAEGDTVTAGQVVMEVETEKAVAEIECPHSGTVTKIHVSPGQSVNIGAVLLTIEEGATSGTTSAVTSTAARPPAPKVAAPSPPPTPPSRVAAEKVAAAPPRRTAPAAAASPARSESKSPAAKVPRDDQADYEAPPPAGPSTRRLARELGVDLRQVTGSGPGGRITADDVQAYVRGLASNSTNDVVAPMGIATLPDFNRFGPIERQPLSKLAKTSSANLSLAWRSVPHVTQHDLADITELEAARKRYMQTNGKSGPKLTMTAIITKAVVGTLQEFPQFNSSLDPATDELVLKHYYHIGIAVDTEFGLMVPVIRDVDQKTVIEIAAELSEIATRTRERKVSLEEMQGGSFTITNLGGIGGTAFTPIVNYPQVAILGMSRSTRQLQLVDGAPQERLLLPLSLSYDHRVVNGADAARFVVRLSRTLSDFFQMLVEC